MIKLILIRHPETDWNKQKRYMGSADIPLNNKGKKQARIISDYLKKEKVSVVYSSELKRALETAKLIAKTHNLKVKQDPRLNEIDFGRLEGMTFEQIQKRYPKVAAKFLFNLLKLKIPEGESFLEFKNRINGFLKEIMAQKKGNAVIVAHGGVNRVIICELLKIPFSHLWQIKQDGGAINKIEIYPPPLFKKITQANANHKKWWGVVSLINHTLWEN